MYNERRNQMPGLMDCLWDTGGVSCEVIRGGKISAGDAVVILPPKESNAASGNKVPVDGGKSSAFYTRPKLRSAAMVQELLEENKQTKQRLEMDEKEGLQRLQRSFEAVGLQF